MCFRLSWAIPCVTFKKVASKHSTSRDIKRSTKSCWVHSCLDVHTSHGRSSSRTPEHMRQGSTRTPWFVPHLLLQPFQADTVSDPSVSQPSALLSPPPSTACTHSCAPAVFSASLPHAPWCVFEIILHGHPPLPGNPWKPQLWTSCIPILVSGLRETKTCTLIPL